MDLPPILHPVSMIHILEGRPVCPTYIGTPVTEVIYHYNPIYNC